MSNIYQKNYFLLIFIISYNTNSANMAHNGFCQFFFTVGPSFFFFLWLKLSQLETQVQKCIYH
jgi:hypothetical protein